MCIPAQRGEAQMKRTRSPDAPPAPSPHSASPRPSPATEMREGAVRRRALPPAPGCPAPPRSPRLPAPRPSRCAASDGRLCSRPAPWGRQRGRSRAFQSVLETSSARQQPLWAHRSRRREASTPTGAGRTPVSTLSRWQPCKATTCQHVCKKVRGRDRPLPYAATFAKWPPSSTRLGRPRAS